jgi:hypothetical protein
VSGHGKLPAPTDIDLRSRNFSPRPADLLAVALAAAERGFHVFPLRPGDKRPALHGADRCPRIGACVEGHATWEARATTDPERIERCWSAAPYNVGIATGPSRLCVIDLDTPKDGKTPPEEWRLPGVVDGADVLAVLCERACQPLPLDTYTVTTTSGGTHLYYRQPADGPELRNTAGALGWLIDTRAGGGYVVAAGSVVGATPYALTYDTGVAELPGWLAERLQRAPLPPQRPVTVPLAADRRGSFLRAAITGELERITGAPDHHNDALYRASVALGQLVAGGALDPDATAQALEHAGVSAGLRPAAARRTIASGFRAGAKRPRTVAA